MERNDKDEVREHLLRGFGKEKSYDEKRRLRENSRRKRAERKRDRPRTTRFDEHDDDQPALQRMAAARMERPRAQREIEFDGEIAGEEAVVVAVDRTLVRVRAADGELDALVTARDGQVAVGDVAVIERIGPSDVVVRALRPRTTRLSRPDPGDPRRERVIAANVDAAVIVVSAASPPFKPAFVDRMLVAVQFGGVQPIVCVNKVDLVAGDRELEALRAALAPVQSLGVPVVLVSARAGTGIGALRELLAHKRCVLVGHSGVGKSSLLNALDPVGERTTGDVRESDGRGRHTTTSSSLREAWPGTELVDTPGVRQFGLWGIDRAELAGYFPEFAAERCRFRDCAHGVEPDCGVRAAVDDGRIARARFAVFARLRAELAGD